MDDLKKLRRLKSYENVEALKWTCFSLSHKAYFLGKVEKKLKLSLQSQEHEKNSSASFFFFLKMDVVSGRKNVVQWLRQETVSQMLRAGPGPSGPCESVLPMRPGGRGAQRAVESGEAQPPGTGSGASWHAFLPLGVVSQGPCG